MRAIRLHGPGDIRLEDVPIPRLRPGTVMIKVSHAGICGSDLFLLRESPIPQEYTHPLTGERGPHILGHEFSGLVTEVADDVVDIDAGALVAVEPILFDGSCAACRRGDTNLCDANGFIGIHGWGGGMSEYVVVPADRVHVMPPELTPETAALIEPLAVAWRSVSRSWLRPGDTALISGAGPIGLALLLVAKARGAGAIVMSEPTASRRAAADGFGAHAVVDPIEDDVVARVRAVTGGQGVDVAFDASGAPTAMEAMFRALRRGGTAVAVAASRPRVFDDNVLMQKELAYVGSYAYAGDDFAQVVEAVRSGAIDPEGFVSTRVALNDAVELGFHALVTEPGNHLKVLVQP
jgi:2-desacetyl-2-hydroxyethyl bacteriochlorophyllide A dehydrogenase